MCFADDFQFVGANLEGFNVLRIWSWRIPWSSTSCPLLQKTLLLLLTAYITVNAPVWLLQLAISNWKVHSRVFALPRQLRVFCDMIWSTGSFAPVKKGLCPWTWSSLMYRTLQYTLLILFEQRSITTTRGCNVQSSHIYPPKIELPSPFATHYSNWSWRCPR